MLGTHLCVQSTWSPASWRLKANSYRITYENEAAAKSILREMETLPPLVTLGELAALRVQLNLVARGMAFVIQCGDCAELFEYCNEASIRKRLALLIRLGEIFSNITGSPTVLLGRMAGQYGKPRNTLMESINGGVVPKFYGDVINSSHVSRRQPNPDRMFEAYARSSMTINYIRSIQSCGIQRLQDIRGSQIQPSTTQSQQNGRHSSYSDMSLPLIFTSHEALFLHYEQAATRREESGGEAPQIDDTAYYNGSAHFLWIGDKTRQLDGAHVEYARGLKNPLGVKLGPSTNPADIASLLDVLNPAREVGKITLITRLGAGHVSQKLGPLIQAVRESNHSVIWQCDPMHGNTRTGPSGLRTRPYSAIVSELVSTIEIHAALESSLGGIHLETTADDVIECVGGPEGWTDEDLGRAYTTKCDPRVNFKQAEAIVEIAARALKDVHRKATIASKI